MTQLFIFTFFIFEEAGGCFFQAEDGIRDYDVTGVQTCALTISNDHDKSRNQQ